MFQMYLTILKFPFFMFQIVSKISTEISDDTKDFIKQELSEENKENQKLWGEHIVCNYVPYRPTRKPLAKLTSKPATASHVVTDFSMKFVNTPSVNAASVSEKQLVSESKVSCYNIMRSSVCFDVFWMHDECHNILDSLGVLSLVPG